MALIKFLDLESGRLFEVGTYYIFTIFSNWIMFILQQNNKMQIKKREELTKQGFCKILWRKLHPWGNLLLEFIHSSGWGGSEGLFELNWEEEGVGAYLRLGAY